MSDKPAKKLTALNNPKLVLSAPCPTAKGKYSQLKWDIYMNSPRIVVRTNDPSDSSPAKSYGQITAALDAPTFYAFLTSLESAIKASGEWRVKIENYNHTFSDGKRDPEVTLQTDLWIGKDKEGVVFLSVISKKEDRPVIKFPFGPSDNRYHKFYHSDGAPYSKPELSVLFAKAYLRVLNELMSHILVTEFKDPPPRTFGGNKPGGNGGGYNKGNYQNNNGGGGGGYSKSAAADISEEDLPF